MPKTKSGFTRTAQRLKNLFTYEPIPLLDYSSSCIDLIFTSQGNLAINSGVHSSLHPNCHHQIFLSKFDLKICHPPLYERII